LQEIGVEEANGQILAFTDDDVVVDKYWLKNIALAFQEYDVACIEKLLFMIFQLIFKLIETQFQNKIFISCDLGGVVQRSQGVKC